MCSPLNLSTSPLVHLNSCLPLHLCTSPPVHVFTSPPVHLSACSPVHRSMCSPVLLSASPPVHMFTCPLVHLPISPPVHLYTFLPVQLFTGPCVHLPLHLFAWPHVYVSTCASLTCPLFHLCTWSPVHVFTCPSLHLFIYDHLFTSPPVHFSTWAPLHLCTSPPVHQCLWFLCAFVLFWINSFLRCLVRTCTEMYALQVNTAISFGMCLSVCVFCHCLSAFLLMVQPECMYFVRQFSCLVFLTQQITLKLYLIYLVPICPFFHGPSNGCSGPSHVWFADMYFKIMKTTTKFE